MPPPTRETLDERGGELLGELVDPLVQRHERRAERSYLLVLERACGHAPDRLALHQLREELDDDEHELRKAPLERIRVGVDARRRRDVEFGDPFVRASATSNPTQRSASGLRECSRMTRELDVRSVPPMRPCGILASDLNHRPLTQHLHGRVDDVITIAHRPTRFAVAACA